MQGAATGYQQEYNTWEIVHKSCNLSKLLSSSTMSRPTLASQSRRLVRGGAVGSAFCGMAGGGGGGC